MPKVIVSGGGNFGRRLGHESRANLMNERDPGRPLTPSTTWGYNENSAAPEEGPHLTMLASWSLTSNLQHCEKYISVVSKLPSLSYFVIAAPAD